MSNCRASSIWIASPALCAISVLFSSGCSGSVARGTSGREGSGGGGGSVGQGGGGGADSVGLGGGGGSVAPGGGGSNGISDAAGPTGGSGGEDARDATMADAMAPAEGNGPAPLIWPNNVSSANSDPWLVQHHTEIQEIHPRFLLIDFANGRTTAAVMTRFQQQKEALMEGSRFHGYSDPASKPFLIYELAKYVDLKDNPIPDGWAAPNSTKMPRRNGGINFSALFTQAYADYYAIPDPANPSHNLTLCELFARGIVNDIYIAFNKTGTDNNVPEILEYKQQYDRNDVKTPGRFTQRAGNGSFDAADLPLVAACGRSVRIDFLEMTGNFTNAMEVLAHNYEHLGTALPRYNEMFKPFGNFNIGDRFGTPFADWYACPYGSATPCLSYPDENAVTYTINGESRTIKPFNQGCGNAHFPPNARGQYDKNNSQTVLTTCEHYGLHDGPGGADLQTPYSVANVARWSNTPAGRGMPGGGWFMYWFQNWPGYGNRATMADGAPMKNWWVYLYY